MQQVKNAYRTDNTLSVAFPFAPLENQFTLRNDRQFPTPISELLERPQTGNSIMRFGIVAGVAPSSAK
jgi:hypothetical protein